MHITYESCTWKIEFYCQFHTQGAHDKPITHTSIIDILCKLIREVLTSECHHLYRNSCSNYIQKPTIQDHHMNKYYFLPFKTIFYSSHKGVPYTTGTLPSYTQRYAFQDHFIKRDASVEKRTNMSSKRQTLTNLKEIKLYLAGFDPDVCLSKF